MGKNKFLRKDVIPSGFFRATKLDKKINDNLQKGVHNLKPSPDCPNDEELLGYLENQANPIYRDLELHLLNCERCYTRGYHLKTKKSKKK